MDARLAVPRADRAPRVVARAARVAALALALDLAGAVSARATGGGAVRLAVPIVAQSPERCGPAALQMVLAHLGADSATVAAADSTWRPEFRGALATDLAAFARARGYHARLARLGADSLVALLREGVAPIVLLRRGVGPLRRGHWAVVTGWDPMRARFVLHDGGARPVEVARRALERDARAADGQVLLVRRP